MCIYRFFDLKLILNGHKYINATVVIVYLTLIKVVCKFTKKS